MATGRLPDPNTAPVTAKGDLYTYSTVPAKLAVGSNGETLVADSSATTGLRWTAGVPLANPVLNSAFQIWQRGTSFVGTTTAFCADRWNAYRNATGSTFSRQTTGDTTNLPNIQYCIRVQRDSGNTSTVVPYLFQDMESVNSIPYAGKTVTFSFYARKGANYSDASSGLGVLLVSGTGTDQSLRGGYTNSTNVIGQTATITTTWQRFSYTGTVGSTVTQLGMEFFFTPVGTAGAADYFEVTGVQIDVGSVALPFRTNGATLAGELATCQRYYEKSYAQGSAPAAVTGEGIVSSTILSAAANAYWGYVPFKVTKRGLPTITIYGYSGGSGKVSTDSTGADQAAGSGAAKLIGESGFSAYNNSGGTVTTSGATVFHWVASAEL